MAAALRVELLEPTPMFSSASIRRSALLDDLVVFHRWLAFALDFAVFPVAAAHVQFGRGNMGGSRLRPLARDRGHQQDEEGHLHCLG